MTSVARLLLDRADDERPALLFEDERYTYRELVTHAVARAAVLRGSLPAGPPHVGVLLDNVPEYVFWLAGAALAGATLVGVNPTRRGAELARDIRHTECGLVVTDAAGRQLLRDVDHGAGILDVEASSYRDQLAAATGALPQEPVDERTTLLLLFTSGVSGAPKACICSQGRLAGIGAAIAQMFSLGPDDVCYVAMPLFHSNALMAGWAPALAAGATVALRRRFSATGFLPDVRRFGATYFNYVGKPLAYILATPEQPDDADNPLRTVFGNEAAEPDIAAFARRFGVRVVDGYGSTEGGASVSRTADLPPGAFGRVSDSVTVLDPDTGAECPPARLGPGGRLLNAEEAVGELVNRHGAAGFEGYWNDPDATAARLRDGVYWTGDLVYRDEAGFLYFAGRDDDWLRVDGENFTAAPVERILGRHPAVALAVVYPVPDPTVGDQVMAAVQLRPGRTFDAGEFAEFLAAQPDLGTKWAPRFVRIGDLPVTATSKVLKRSLREQRWLCDDPVWWRPGRSLEYRPLDRATAERLAGDVDRRAPARL